MNIEQQNEVKDFKEAQDFWNSCWEHTKFEDLPKEVQAELSDFSKAISTWSKVAYDLSGGKISKPNYTADVYIDLFEENLQYAVEEAEVETRSQTITEVIKKLENITNLKVIATDDADRAWNDVIDLVEDVKSSLQHELGKGADATN